MYWILGIAAIGVAYAWLSNEEQRAVSSYHLSSERLAKETHTRKQQLNRYRQQNQAIQHYHKHIELHFNSVQTANACYAHYDDQKKLLRMLDDKIEQFIKTIIALKKQRDTASITQKQQIRIQLQTMREYFKQAKAERQTIKAQKSALLDELRDINQKTRELKLYIRDECGNRGHDWYQRHYAGRLT